MKIAILNRKCGKCALGPHGLPYITVCTTMQAKIFQGQKSFQKKAHFDFDDPECRSKKNHIREKNTAELEVPPSKERCAMWKSEVLLNSSYVVNLMIF